MSHFDLKKEYFTTFLKNDDKNFKALGNYQEPTEFKFVNNSKKKLYVTKITILVEDNRILKDENYGSESQLDNGITAYFTKEKIRREIIEELPITSNKDWLCYPCSVQTKTFSLGHKFLKITFKSSKHCLNLFLYTFVTYGVGYIIFFFSRFFPIFFPVLLSFNLL